jgi:hypothetical protein
MTFQKHREPTKAQKVAETRTSARLHVSHAGRAIDRANRLRLNKRSTTQAEQDFTHHIRQAAKANRELRKLKG